eukprot:6466780-Amphidinium_carterae.2
MLYTLKSKGMDMFQLPRISVWGDSAFNRALACCRHVSPRVVSTSLCAIAWHDYSGTALVRLQEDVFVAQSALLALVGIVLALWLATACRKNREKTGFGVFFGRAAVTAGKGDA